MKKVNVMFFGVALAVAMALTACGGSSTPTEQPNTDSVNAANTEIRAAGEEAAATMGGTECNGQGAGECGNTECKGGDSTKCCKKAAGECQKAAEGAQAGE